MTEKLAYKVEGLDCAEEVAILQKVLGKEEGVLNLDFNILSAKMVVTIDPTKTSSYKIESAVARTGMRASPWEEGGVKKREWRKVIRTLSTFISLLFLLLGIFTHFSSHPDFTQLVAVGYKGHSLTPLTKLFYLLAIVSAIWMIVPKAYVSIRFFRPDMNLLMVIAILGAIGIGEWFEAATVAFLFSLALFLEERSVEVARRAVTHLLDLAPPSCFLLDETTQQIIEKPVKEIGIGTSILIRPGEKIPLDGVVIKGTSSIDEAPITGESLPVSKEIGDEVFAGTLNHDGALEVRVTKRAEETTLAKIINLVDEARAKRSKSELWVEKFAKIYTPIMLLLALLVMFLPPLFLHGGYAPWIYRGLVLLVIACPCALVISTPVSLVSALTGAAKKGVLIKGGVFLELMGQIRAIALDKTGTLTFGHPEVQRIVPLAEHTEAELLLRAASLEQNSEHPIARAIFKKATNAKIIYPPALNFTVIKGKGATATILGKNYWIGSHRFMHDQGQETEEIHNQAVALEDAGHTMVAIGTDDHVCGLILVADAPRPGIEKTIEALKVLGIEKIMMLTGDNEPTASAIAKVTGVDAYQAQLLPEDKVEAIGELAKIYGKIAMVGDGINDAPALAAATVGIAMGGMGADAAIEVADIVLMKDDLAKVPWLIQHARRTLRIVMQNITFALGIKLLFFILALLGYATLAMAIAADTGATLLVIFNALRLNTFRSYLS